MQGLIAGVYEKLGLDLWIFLLVLIMCWCISHRVTRLMRY